eukprot:365356-Chlamydomonas_euryale.AAC.3
MESQEWPGSPARPTGANGLENHVAISLVNLFRSSNSAAQDNSSLGSHVDGFSRLCTLVHRSEQEHRERGGSDSEDAGVHAVSSDEVDITKEDSNGAIVGEKSLPEFWMVGTSAPGCEVTCQASILSFSRQLTRQEKKKMQLGASSLTFGCLEQARMLKRKPGRPPKLSHWQLQGG